ncbi:UPF0738 family protein [Staphylococcus epidermidis]|uniref:UPF0738 family protein n=1 Tax=Staphylococcus epidermidis TaxID=1282 RepID=UPI0037DA0654
MHQNTHKPIIINNHLQLNHFQQQLHYLFNNIQRNNNYRNHFVSPLQKTFQLHSSGVKQNQPLPSIFNPI